MGFEIVIGNERSEHEIRHDASWLGCNIAWTFIFFHMNIAMYSILVDKTLYNDNTRCCTANCTLCTFIQKFRTSEDSAGFVWSEEQLSFCQHVLDALPVGLFDLLLQLLLCEPLEVLEAELVLF
jgi:hypothetical protein